MYVIPFRINNILIDRADDMAIDEAGKEAIRAAVKALRKRHLLEEGAHAPAILALQRPFASQGLEWKEKYEKLELELQQCYKAQSRLSEQLVVEVAECRNLKASLQEKESSLAAVQNELSEEREESSQLRSQLDKKTEECDLLISENEALKVQLDDMTMKAKNAEAENKKLIDRWMLEKMKDAEKLNEVNAMYEDMMARLKMSSIEQLAREQVDGVVRRHESGRDNYVESTVPSACKQTIHAHVGGCASLLFEHKSNKFVSGGQDQSVKIWDSANGNLITTLRGCLGSVLDLAISHDNRSVIAASSKNSLFVWDVESGQLRHTLTGHQDKVCAVDANKSSSRHIVSAGYDRTIRLWDLQKGYSINTILSGSNCNALCYNTDGVTICSGHMDGSIRLWDARNSQLITEVAAHSQAVTSVCLSHNGNIVLSSGRDNLHNLFDMRTLEVCGTLRASGSRMASNWSRSCLSPDDSYVAAGSADGSLHVWSISGLKLVATLKEHGASILSCSWSELGKSLVSADKNGTLCIWT